MHPVIFIELFDLACAYRLAVCVQFLHSAHCAKFCVQVKDDVAYMWVSINMILLIIVQG